jgi:tripartite-type tricarboxylate transporter receptor subunit TctC
MQHFTGALFAKAAGINFQLVDYKGGAPSIVDTLGGQISSTMTALSEVTPYLDDPRMRILASSGAERSPVVPKLPTFAEWGYKECVLYSFSGFFAAAKTPKDLIDAANVAVNRAVVTKKIYDEMLVLGSNPLTRGLTPQAFGANVKSDWLRFQTLVKQTGFQAED